VPPSLHQIGIYRRRAAEMEMLAAETKFAQMQQSYLRLAEEWTLLADSLEDQMRRAKGLPVDHSHGRGR
jgi:hypothetical protein